MPPSRPVVQRSSIATVAVIGVAVAMLALLVARTRVVAHRYLEASRDLDQLLLLETGCVVLLLAAIGLAVRHAIRSTRAQLEATVVPQIEELDDWALIEEAEADLLGPWGATRARRALAVLRGEIDVDFFAYPPL